MRTRLTCVVKTLNLPPLQGALQWDGVPGVETSICLASCPNPSRPRRRPRPRPFPGGTSETPVACFLHLLFFHPANCLDPPARTIKADAKHIRGFNPGNTVPRWRALKGRQIKCPTTQVKRVCISRPFRANH